MLTEAEAALLMCLRRAFAMMSLAIAASFPREKLNKLPQGFRLEPVPVTLRGQLGRAIRDGDVTVIVTHPYPLSLIYYDAFPGIHIPYGVWIGRPASWKGKLKPKQDAEVNSFGEFLASHPGTIDGNGEEI